MHRRSAIQSAILAALGPLVPSVVANVFSGRVYPISVETELPAINVRLGAESTFEGTDRGGSDFVRQVRNLEISLEIWTTDEGDIDLAADNIALEVERVLVPTVLGPFADWFRHAGSAEPERDGELAGPIIARVLEYDVRYDIDVTDPQ